MRKLLLLFLMAVAFLVGSVSATDVVLVSDNAADQCTALEVADALNATVFTTTWGIYNESLVSEIENLNPEKVIIIGGPLAVVENYTIALENAGITVERIGGTNRYETNANATLTFQNQFKHMFGDNATACVCYGFDDIALNETMQKVRNRSCLLLLTNGTNLSVEPQKLQLRINKVEIIENPICPFCNYSKVMMQLKRHGINISVEQISEERVKLMLQNRIRLMERKIEMLKKMGVNTTELEEKLKEAEQLMEQNKLQEAYRIMIQLQEEQMVKVKTHLHPNWGEMRRGSPHQNLNSSENPVGKMGENGHHQRINTTTARINQ
ncbi:cell wall-binding repeat-containing protein [Methanocaldococcus vulcanius]|nr:cell wall-binding repeat-containing protein [Methanocaldococcus vulcanius]